MPMPVSETMNSTKTASPSGAFKPRTVRASDQGTSRMEHFTVPPASVYFTAFDTKFTATERTCTGLPTTHGC